MKRDPVGAALQALAEAARRPGEAATLALVRDSLAHRGNHVAGRAARARARPGSPRWRPTSSRHSRGSSRTRSGAIRGAWE